MSKSTTLLATLMAVLSFGVVTSAASATPVIGAPGTAGPFSITSTVTGLNHAYSIGGAVFTCNTVTFASAGDPMFGLGSPSNAVTFKPRFANCSLALNGVVCGVTMTTNDTWTLAATSLKSGTAGTNGAAYRTGLTLNGSPSTPNTTITTNSCGLTCTINLQAQSIPAAGMSGLQLANVSTSHVRLTGTFNSVAFTSSGCPGIAAVGTSLQYTLPSSSGGPVLVPGVYVTGA